MSKVFINIQNNHFQIDNFICTLEEFSKIEKSFIIPSNIAEIECNTDESQRQCIKDDDSNALGIPTELQTQLLGYVQNITTYQTSLAILREPEPLTLDEVRTTKISQIKSLRDIFVTQDITTSKGLVFAADSDAQFRIYVAFKEWNSIMTLNNLDPATATYPWGSTGNVTESDLQEAYTLIQARLAKVCGVETPELEAQVNTDVYTKDSKGNPTTTVDVEATRAAVEGVVVRFG